MEGMSASERESIRRKLTGTNKDKGELLMKQTASTLGSCLRLPILPSLRFASEALLSQ